MKNPIKMYDKWLEEKLGYQASFFDLMQAFASVLGLIVAAVVAVVFTIAFIGSAVEGPCVGWKAEQCVDSHGATYTCKGACVKHQND